jgi:hypothetical protein
VSVESEASHRDADQGSDIGALAVILIELYYWLTIVLTLFIRIGFCMYEVGTAPTKTMLHLEHRCGLGLAHVRLDGAMRRHFAMNRSIGM